MDYLNIQYCIVRCEVQLRVKIKNAKYVLLRFKKNYFYDRGGSFVFT